MRIEDWECAASEGGAARGVSHATRGTFTWLNGRLIGHGDAPPAVMEWLLRPRLRRAWEAGCVVGLGCPNDTPSSEAYAMNPHNGEPPNKDSDPS